MVPASGTSSQPETLCVATRPTGGQFGQEVAGSPIRWQPDPVRSCLLGVPGGDPVPALIAVEGGQRQGVGGKARRDDQRIGDRAPG